MGSHKLTFTHLFTLTALTYQLMAGCSSGLTEGPDKVDNEGQLVESIAFDYTGEYLAQFQVNIKKLNNQARQVCSNGEETKNLNDLKNTWEEAMFEYHKLKVVLHSPETVLDEESKSPLRFIYRPHPPVQATKFIRKRIKDAAKLQNDYKMKRPLSHSTGLNALENLLFNLMTLNPEFADDSGECVFLKYTTRKLLERTDELQRNWNEAESLRLKSASGKTEVRGNLSAITSHIVAYTDKKLKSLGVAAPLGLRPEQHPCEESCSAEYLEHPFYSNQKISLVAPLEVLQDLFTRNKNSDGGQRFNFSDYLRSRNPEIVFSKSLAGLDEALRLAKELPTGETYVEAFDGNIFGFKEAEVILENLTTFTDWLKVDFLMEMNTDIPQAVQGDND